MEVNLATLKTYPLIPFVSVPLSSDLEAPMSERTIYLIEKLGKNIPKWYDDPRWP